MSILRFVEMMDATFRRWSLAPNLKGEIGFRSVVKGSETLGDRMEKDDIHALSLKTYKASEWGQA